MFQSNIKVEQGLEESARSEMTKEQRVSIQHKSRARFRGQKVDYYIDRFFGVSIQHKSRARFRVVLIIQCLKTPYRFQSNIKVEQGLEKHQE